MNFSLSIFTVEIHRRPSIAFQAKWYAEADEICQEWLRNHWNDLATKGPGGVDMPPIFKLRLAQPSEKAIYEADGAEFELVGDVKIVRLIDAADRAESSPPSEESSPNGIEAVQDETAVGSLTPENGDSPVHAPSTSGRESSSSELNTPDKAI